MVDIFKVHADVICCTVNCVGVMGAGLALSFKKEFPPLEFAYRKLLREGTLRIGSTCIVKMANPYHQAIALVPTKLDWRQPSRVEYVTSAYESLHQNMINLQFKSVAVPPLGCGLGGLNWKEIKPLLQQIDAKYPSNQVIYTA